MLWQIIVGAVGVLCLSYYALICGKLRRWDSTFSRFWLVSGILCLIVSVVFRTQLYQWVMNCLFAAVGISACVTAYFIIRTMVSDHNEDCRYLIVLGAHVAGRSITDSLRRRLDRAVRYAACYPQVMIIVSGGQGAGEEITEAEAMESYLIGKGIRKERIKKEDRSATTEENLKFSKKYIGDVSDRVGIVSNNFHVYRALCYAKRLGYKDVCPVACDCHPLLFLNYIVREFFAVWKMWLTKCHSVL